MMAKLEHDELQLPREIGTNLGKEDSRCDALNVTFFCRNKYALLKQKYIKDTCPPQILADNPR